MIDKKTIHNNSLQVINQYATEDGQRANRYDVTVLVNGLPLVHIELNAVVWLLGMPLIRSTAISEKVFGQQADFLNMYNYLSFPTVLIQNITAIQLDFSISRTQAKARLKKEKSKQ